MCVTLNFSPRSFSQSRIGRLASTNTLATPTTVAVTRTASSIEYASSFRRLLAGSGLLDTSGGGAGCEARAASEDGSRADAYDPIIRHRIVAPVTGAYPALSVVRKTLALTRDAETAVLLRASDDPHVWLLNATDGTAAFAAAQSRLNAAGIAFVVLAAVFSIPAICLLLPMLYDKYDGERSLRT